MGEIGAQLGFAMRMTVKHDDVGRRIGRTVGGRIGDRQPAKLYSFQFKTDDNAAGNDGGSPMANPATTRAVSVDIVQARDSPTIAPNRVDCSIIIELYGFTFSCGGAITVVCPRLLVPACQGQWRDARPWPTLRPEA